MTEQPKPDAPASSDRLRALIELWRAEGRRCESFHATMGTGYTACADDLEAVVKEVMPQGLAGSVIAGTELEGDQGKPDTGCVRAASAGPASALSATSEHIDSAKIEQQIPREPPDADARFLLTDLLEALRSKSTGLCRLCGCVSADMSHYPDSPCGRVEALLPRLDQQMKPLRPDGCKARNTFGQACYGRDGHTAHCVFGGSVDVPPVLLPRLDAAPQSHRAFSDLVTRATEYVNKIIIESDGYPMAHSAADMRTVLVNAFLAGADERRPRLDAAPQEPDLSEAGIITGPERLVWTFVPNLVEVRSGGGTPTSRLVELLKQTRHVVIEQRNRIRDLEQQLALRRTRL